MPVSPARLLPLLMATWLWSGPLGAAPARGAPPATDPHVELLTMGQSPEIYHRFGHAALCLVYHRTPDETRCFNYGTADFQSPPQKLGWAFLRGTARFWVSVQSYELMLWAYRHDDRDIWIQRLPLTQVQVNRLAARLDHDAKEENRYYVYHHFFDNCATRLRDHLDAVTGGALSRDSEAGIGLTFREVGRRGLADKTPIIAAALLLLGRRMDREVTVWQSMFHPDYLRPQVAKRLGAPAVAFYRRKGPPIPTEGSQGLGWILLAALALALPLGVVRLVDRLRPLARLNLAERLALVLPALALTLLALLIDFVVVASTVPEMRWNEAVLIFWPTDLLLIVLGLRRRRQYARIRLASIGIFVLALAVGLARQPLWVPLLLPTLTIALAAFDWGPRRSPTEQAHHGDLSTESPDSATQPVAGTTPATAGAPLPPAETR